VSPLPKRLFHTKPGDAAGLEAGTFSARRAASNARSYPSKRTASRVTSAAAEA
jgi:hypothetical protein